MRMSGAASALMNAERTDAARPGTSGAMIAVTTGVMGATMNGGTRDVVSVGMSDPMIAALGGMTSGVVTRDGMIGVTSQAMADAVRLGMTDATSAVMSDTTSAVMCDVEDNPIGDTSTVLAGTVMVDGLTSVGSIVAI